MTINDEDATLASDGCRLLTIDAAADFLAISRGAVYHLLDRGEVASIHIGRSRRIALAELRRFVAKSEECYTRYDGTRACGVATNGRQLTLDRRRGA